MDHHVIRSSNANLTAIETFVNTEEHAYVLRPRMTIYTRSGKKRRPKSIRVLMYPGYAFVHPASLDHLHSVRERWPHHFLRSPATCEPLRVPEDQVQYALDLERRSVETGRIGKPFERLTRVVFTDDRLHGLRATVQKCSGHTAIVWPDGYDYPVTCLLADIEPLLQAPSSISPS